MGPITLHDGSIYTGQWLNGMRDGLGVIKWPKEGSKECEKPKTSYEIIKSLVMD